MKEVLRGSLLILSCNLLQIGSWFFKPSQKICIERVDLFLELFHNSFFLFSQDAVGSPVKGMASHLLDFSREPLDLFGRTRQVWQNPDRFVKQNGTKAS